MSCFIFFQLDDGLENPTAAGDRYLTNLLSRDDFHVLAAIEKDRVVGGLTAYELVKYKREETEMFLYELGVCESHRRRGIARALIAELKRICLKKKIHVLFVATEMDNDPARRLYEKTGGRFESAAFYTYQLC